MKEVEEGIQWPCGLGNAGKGGFRALHLGDVGVAHLLDHSHASRRTLGFLKRMDQSQRSARMEEVFHGPDELPEQRITAAQMMVEEGERRADGEGMEPERDFGELD